MRDEHNGTSVITGPTEHETESWRILLVARNGEELLVLKRPLGLSLPVLHIPRHERIAESLNMAAQRRWNLETVCVAPFLVPHPDSVSGDARYHIMEVRRPEDLSRIAPQTRLVASLEADAFADIRDGIAVRRAMKLDTGDSHPSEGPFGECGSFQEIAAWIEQQLAQLGRKWDGVFRQLHASESFALIRFQTDDGAVWFKATGEPNRREFAITERLSAVLPESLPEIISARKDWNAWLANEVTGTNLESASDGEPWCRAATSLAELQIASIDHTSALLDCGAHDSCTAALLSRVMPFFAEIEYLMGRQSNTVLSRLRSSELQSLSLRLVEALNQMESLAIPDTLNHFDLNPANVIVQAGACTFLDWAEAAVGNPFLSFEYLRQHLLRTFGDAPEAAARLRKSYADVWSRRLPESVIHRAMELMPLLAPFAFATTALPWNAPRRETPGESAGFLRSLARQMYREAQQLRHAA